MQLSASDQRKQAAEVALKEAMRDLYGEEKTIIVENRQKGVVSIGFGKNGSEGGYSIPRSKLPVNLTAIFPAEFWLASPDFRQALGKGWLRIVSQEEYDKALAAEAAHQARLEAIAATDGGGSKGPQRFDAEINPLQASVVDERTSQLRDVSADPELASRVAEYEKRHDTTPLNPAVIKDGRSARAEALVEETRRGSINAIEALTRLDQDAPLYTTDDLEYIAQNAAYPGVASFAKSLATSKE